MRIYPEKLLTLVIIFKSKGPLGEDIGRYSNELVYYPYCKALNHLASCQLTFEE